MLHYIIHSAEKFNNILLGSGPNDIYPLDNSATEYIDDISSSGKNPESAQLYAYRLPKSAPFIIKGALCLRSTMHDPEICEIDGNTYRIGRDNPLLISAGEPSSIMIDPENKTISSNFFWGERALNQVFLAHSLPLEESIDADWENYKVEVNFSPRLNQGRDIINYMVEKIDRECRKQHSSDSEYIAEMMYMLLKTIFLTQNNLSDQIGDIRSVKAPQKIEILKRLSLAKNCIDSCFRDHIDISTVAQMSKLSKYHFIRLFREIYGITPRQYLINKRMELAKKLLGTTDKSITEIGAEIGLNNSSYFTSLFRSVYSFTPGEFRKLCKHIL